MTDEPVKQPLAPALKDARELRDQTKFVFAGIVLVSIVGVVFQVYCKSIGKFYIGTDILIATVAVIFGILAMFVAYVSLRMAEIQIEQVENNREIDNARTEKAPSNDTTSLVAAMRDLATELRNCPKTSSSVTLLHYSAKIDQGQHE